MTARLVCKTGLVCFRASSDGGDTVRDLQLYLNPQAEHLLDWFHVTMRITVMNQVAKGIKYKAIRTESLDTLESIKWYLWYGNVLQALQEIEDRFISLDTDRTTPEQTKLSKLAAEFDTYIRNNRLFPTMAIATGTGNGSQRDLWSLRSIRWSVSGWSKNNRCAGVVKEHTDCCRSGLVF